jgi:hypothetical protein
MIARLWGRSRPRDEHRASSDRGGSGSSNARRTAQLAAASLTVVALTALFTSAASAQAQTWSQNRERPSLFEIVAIDETAQSLWPFGQEDLAKDGVATYAVDEKAVDLRSLYADTRTDGLWVRAYVESDVEPMMSAVVFFFIDNDANAKTGAKAEGDMLFDGWSTDPSPGGYELAVGMRGDGTLIGVFQWDDAKDVWALQPDKPVLVTLETGKARDPLRLSGDDHGYFQIKLDRRVLKLADGCTGPLFVRTWNDAMAARAFGDSSDVTLCTPRLNAYGDVEILGTDECDSDSSCPARGKCREHVCVIEYECTQDSECRDGEDCMGSVCVRVVDKTCDSAGDCDGLVCANDRCTACAASGARACASGYLCTPNGTCIRPGETGTAGRGGSGGRSGSDDGHSGEGGAAGARVRGGAFTCALLTRVGAGESRGDRAPWIAAGVLAAVGLVFSRKRRRNRGDR